MLPDSYLQAWQVDDFNTWPFIEKVKKLIPNIKNKFLLEKYLKPYIWEGWLWVNDGWGPKDKIQNMMLGDPVSGFKIPFLLQPYNELLEKEIVGPDGNQYYTTTETDHKYHVAFPGEQYQILIHIIDELIRLGVEEQKYVLNSYFSTQVPNEGSPIFQLHIEVKKNEINFRVEKGKWVPSFEDTLTVAGW